MGAICRTLSGDKKKPIKISETKVTIVDTVLTAAELAPDTTQTIQKSVLMLSLCLAPSCLFTTMPQM